MRVVSFVYKCFKLVIVGYFFGFVLFVCINNRIEKYKFWNLFCRGWNIKFLLFMSNILVGFFYRIFFRNGVVGKGILDMYFLKDGSLREKIRRFRVWGIFVGGW